MEQFEQFFSPPGRTSNDITFPKTSNIILGPFWGKGNFPSIQGYIRSLGLHVHTM